MRRGPASFQYTWLGLAIPVILIFLVGHYLVTRQCEAGSGRFSIYLVRIQLSALSPARQRLFIGRFHEEVVTSKKIMTAPVNVFCRILSVQGHKTKLGNPRTSCGLIKRYLTGFIKKQVRTIAYFDYYFNCRIQGRYSTTSGLRKNTFFSKHIVQK